MRIGFCERFDGPGKDVDYVREFAALVERHGFDSLWMPDHLAFFDEITSTYPYTASGIAPVPPDPGFPDPFVTLAAAATATERLLLGTAVVILPERHPLITAKQSATLDVLSRGRFVLGVGVGWMREEYAALGVPWEDRGRRCTEYIEAIKMLWTTDRSTYEGSTVRFRGAISYPKPARTPHPPIYVGGNSGPALRRAAGVGDGWFGWALTPDELAATRTRLEELLAAAGRGPDEVAVQVGLMHRGSAAEIAADVCALWNAGADRVVLSVPFTADDFRTKITAIADALDDALPSHAPARNAHHNDGTGRMWRRRAGPASNAKGNPGGLHNTSHHGSRHPHL